MTSPRFVVQRHRASRLHYDFRLEVGGSLASWAVPKGPTLDPKARQLAVRVEDHSLEYFDFEGVIPKGQYGGGDVIVWDWGTWQPAENTNPADAIKRGELHFDVRGEKLAGRFVLVRTGRDKRGRDKWLLIHKNDDHARRGWNPEDLPRSVKSGRTNDEIVGQWLAPSPDDLAALDELDGQGRWRIGGRDVRLTNLDKVLFPGPDPLTKRDLIRYYARIGPYMVPYLEGRPINANRFPDGVAAHGFWHKEIPDHAPDWITRWYNTEADDDETHCYAVLDSVPSLVWMANFAGIELHPWTSRLADVHQPTWALVDIDPGSRTTFDEILELARLYRTALDHLGVAGMPKLVV